MFQIFLHAGIFLHFYLKNYRFTVCRITPSEQKPITLHIVLSLSFSLSLREFFGGVSLPKKTFFFFIGVFSDPLGMKLEFINFFTANYLIFYSIFTIRNFQKKNFFVHFSRETLSQRLIVAYFVYNIDIA